MAGRTGRQYWRTSTAQQAANQGQDPSRGSSQEQEKMGPETRLELQHRSERSSPKPGLESGYFQHRSKVPPRSTAVDRAGNTCTYNSAQERAECPGPCWNRAPEPTGRGPRWGPRWGWTGLSRPITVLGALAIIPEWVGKSFKVMKDFSTTGMLR